MANADVIQLGIQCEYLVKAKFWGKYLLKMYGFLSTSLCCSSEHNFSAEVSTLKVDMINFAAGKCVACRAGEPTLTDIEIEDLLLHVQQWQVQEVDGMKRVEKVYKFKNFVQALEFTNKVGAIAEEENHHPLIITEWERVTLQWWTHVIKGLHKNDFIMAAKADELVSAKAFPLL